MGAVLSRPAMPLAVLAAFFSNYGNTPRLDPPQYFTPSHQASFWPTLPPAPAHSYGASIHNVTSQEVTVAASGAGVNGGNVTRVLSPHAAFFVQAALFVLARLAADFPLIAYTERAHALVALVALAIQLFPGITFSLIQDGIVQLLLAIGIAVWLLRRDLAATHRMNRYKHDEAKATNALSKVRKDNEALARQNEALQAQGLKLLDAKKEHERQITGNLEEIGTLKGNLTAERKKHLNTHNALRAWEARRVEIGDKMRLAELAEGSLETLRKKKQAVLNEIDALRKEHTRVERTARLAKQLEQATEALERANSTTHGSAQKEELVADVEELSKRLTVAHEDGKQATQKVMDLQGKQDAGTKTDDQTSKSISTTTASSAPSASTTGQTEPGINPQASVVSDSLDQTNIRAVPPSIKETMSFSKEPSSYTDPSPSDEQQEGHQVSDISAHQSPDSLAASAQSEPPSITNPTLAKILETLKAGPTLKDLEVFPANTTESDFAQDGSAGDIEARASLINTENTAQPSAIEDETGDSVSPLHYELQHPKMSLKTPARTSRVSSDSASSLRIAVLKDSQTKADFQALFLTPSNTGASAQQATVSDEATLSASAQSSTSPTIENNTSTSVNVQPEASSAGDAPSTQTAKEVVTSTTAPHPSTPAPEQLNSSASASLPPTKADASVLSPSRLPGLDPSMWVLESTKKEPAQPGLCFYRPHMKPIMRKGVVRSNGQTFPCDRKDCVGDSSKYDQLTGKLIVSGDPKAWLYGGSSDEDESARRFTAWDLKLCYACYVEELSRSEAAEEEKEAEKPKVDDDQDRDAEFDQEAYEAETQAGKEATREQEQYSDKLQADQDENVDDDFDEEVYGNETKTGEEVTHEQGYGEQEEEESAEDPDGDAIEAALYAEFAEQNAEKEKTEEEKTEVERTEEAVGDGTNMATVDGFTMKDLVDAIDLTGVETDSSPPTATSPGRPDLSVYQDPTMTFDQAMEKASNKSRRHGPYDTCGG